MAWDLSSVVPSLPPPGSVACFLSGATGFHLQFSQELSPSVARVLLGLLVTHHQGQQLYPVLPLLPSNGSSFP